MPAERLRPQDATLWCAQAPDAPLQIGALCLFEGAPLRDASGAIDIDALRVHVTDHLAGLPRFHTRLQTVPLDQGLVWVDDESFDIARHVGQATLPAPGGEHELRALVAPLIEAPLDPSHPLWEIWVVDGVAGDRVAVVVKASHVMADGMAILEFALSVLAPEPRAVSAGEPPTWAPSPAPGPVDLLVGEWMARGRGAVELAVGLARGMMRPDRLVRRMLTLGRVGAGTATLAPALPITAPVGPHRDFGWVRLPIDDLVRVKRAHGTTLNDVVLAVVAGAVRRYLLSRGAASDADARVLVPVSTHAQAGEEIENRFSMMVADLPVSLDDPIERLGAVHREMEQHKAAGQADLGPLIFTFGGLVPPRLLEWLAPPILRRQPFVNLAVTDLPGTREPMYLLGARMLELFPFVGVTGNIALIVGALSYEDGLGIGVTVDADVIPDIDALIATLVTSADELVAATVDPGVSPGA